MLTEYENPAKALISRITVLSTNRSRPNILAQLFAERQWVRGGDVYYTCPHYHYCKNSCKSCMHGLQDEYSRMPMPSLWSQKPPGKRNTNNCVDILHTFSLCGRSVVFILQRKRGGNQHLLLGRTKEHISHRKQSKNLCLTKNDLLRLIDKWLFSWGVPGHFCCFHILNVAKQGMLKYLSTEPPAPPAPPPPPRHHIQKIFKSIFCIFLLSYNWVKGEGAWQCKYAIKFISRWLLSNKFFCCFLFLFGSHCCARSISVRQPIGTADSQINEFSTCGFKNPGNILLIPKMGTLINAKVRNTVLGPISASSDTVESEGLQMKHAVLNSVHKKTACR
jgi:hypothetical protein